MPRRSRILTRSGKDVPTELRDLPVGRYVVEAVENEAAALTPEEEAGIEVALESYRQGRVVDSRRPRDHRRTSDRESAVWAHPAIASTSIIVKDVGKVICWRF